MNIIFLLTLAYLIGSIPTAVWVSKRIYGLDIREHGSGNAGATNTFRVLGKKAGIGVMIVDMLKGFAAVKSPCHPCSDNRSKTSIIHKTENVKLNRSQPTLETLR